MVIVSIICIILISLFYIFYNLYLKEYVELTKVYKTLRKVLEVRDLMLLKILPDLDDKELAERVLNLIDERKKKSLISYDDAILADINLHNELKIVYDKINKMQKNDLQEEIFKRLIVMEKQLREIRRKYSDAVTKYNMSLTIHPKICIKLLHMRAYEIYGTKK